ncbi:MAG: ATP-binding cassette domain-containing protein [Bacteroidales bacterium]|jgi:ABC-2 type transport system ATP-binding protein|nr:ATP-binding cassette domain-containing protein [Bacteroidales bacterium]
MSIVANHLTKFYGTQKALNDVSFEIPKGQIVGLLGPNGAGKSTLMKILTTYLPADEGTALVNEFSVEKQPLNVRQHIGYLPENNPLYLDMYVREYLAFSASLYLPENAIKPAVEDIIEKTLLTTEMHKTIGQLSKGYRQRVGLAAALVHQPQVLILDEPTTGLDPNQLLEIRQLILELGREKTVLLSTHIMQEVEALCDRVLIINKGNLVIDTLKKDVSNIEHLFHEVTK